MGGNGGSCHVNTDTHKQLTGGTAMLLSESAKKVALFDNLQQQN